jgi:hypothetical protein
LNFKRSFNPDIQLPDDGCSWRWHFPPGVLREVMPYLDLLAKQHPMRYAYARPSAIAAGTKNYAKPGHPPFSRVAVEKALEYLRAIRFLIASPWTRKGKTVDYGHFVLSHDSSCRPEARCCVCFMFDPELPELKFKQPRNRKS